MTKILKSVGDVLLGRLLLYVILVPIPVAAVLLLVGGTEALTAVGLSKSLAGNIVTFLVVALCVAGLGAFAKYGIDW